MTNKLQAALQLADDTARQVTGSYQAWTTFLTTAARLYKYPFPEQLMIYAALFCLEYGIKPSEIGMELRIYQNDKVLCHNATVEDIFPIMDRIITFDKIINRMREQEG